MIVSCSILAVMVFGLVVYFVCMRNRTLKLKAKDIKKRKRRSEL